MKRKAGRFVPIKDEVVKEWLQMRMKGITTTVIAKKYKVNTSTVIRKTRDMLGGADLFNKKTSVSSKRARLHPIMYALGSSSGWVSRTDYDYGTKYMSRS